MGLLSEEIAAYEKMRDILETDYFGKWVIVHDGQLIGTYDEFEKAAVDAVRKFGRGPYLIRQVGEPPMFVPSVFLPAGVAPTVMISGNRDAPGFSSA